ncbi:hypothetical protein [Aliiroseovarius sp.]|uniref:hypothetical protein n=1 Tax=Aliiroseovarius sp. TaxID=1872442 RepID=UPI002630C6DA|nr:hypothetical protein [Aliiroseovarius sp.]
MAFLKRMWAAAPVATVVLGLALVVSLLFVLRMTAFGIYWNDPARRDQAIQPWMTPRYVAHSWQVPPDVLMEALELEGPPGMGPTSLRDVAERLGMPVEALILRLEQAITDHRAAQGTEPGQ